MATFSTNVGNTTGDDASESSAGTVTINGVSFNIDGDDEWGLDLFRGLGLMDGGEIISAVVQYKVTDSGSDEPDVTFWGVAENNTPAALVANHNISSRPRTTASVAWNNANLGATAAQFFAAPDFTTILQEMADNGWIELGVFGVVYTSTSGTGSRDFQRFTQDNDPDDSAIIDVTYIPAAPNVDRTILDSAGLSTVIIAAVQSVQSRVVAAGTVGCATPTMLDRIFARLISDLMRIADVPSRRSVAQRSAVELLPVADAVRTRNLLLRALFDDISIDSSQVEFNLLLRRFCAEIVGQIDEALQSVEWRRRAIELLGHDDNVLRVVDAVRRIVNELAANDEAAPRRIRGSLWPGDTTVAPIGPGDVGTHWEEKTRTAIHETGPGAVRIDGSASL